MNLISYEAALDILRDSVLPISESEQAPLERAVGRALAMQVTASDSSPRFHNSAVDGYAIFHANDLLCGSRLRVIGETQAGTEPALSPAKGECIRIFTGAIVQEGCVAVVMQEDISRDGAFVTMLADCQPRANIREAGVDFVRGDRLLEAGDRINPGSVSLLASQGLTHVQVFRRPTAAIISTGEELVHHSEAPSGVQIRNSNAPMTRALVEQFGCEVSQVATVGDSYEDVKKLMLQASRDNDLIIASGGASVGDYDQMPRLLTEEGKVFFRGVQIKPGKPVMLGQLGDAYVLALPGNPASAFVCFYLFGVELIRRRMGVRQPQLCWFQILLDGDWQTKNRDEFVRCFASAGTARVASDQGSYGLASLAYANCIVRIPADTQHRSGEPRDALALL